ncbi:MAG: alpha/beta hydrolase [Anaerolineae bacterium]|nr:alpha/beta hydrolase [Anaerolineae bacterium]
MVQECWAQSGDIRLHYLDNQASGPGIPVMFIPGLHGSAEDFEPALRAIAPRRAIAVSLRGRGKSDVPEAGYRFENHVKDLAALVETFNVGPVAVVAHSVGVPYAIGYALEYPRQVAALVLAGYPARYPDLSADWGLRSMMRYPEAMSMIAVLGLQHDSVEISLWESLAELQCPLLVLRGAKATSRLPEELAEEYRRWVSDAHIVVFPNSGHRLWVPSMQRFIQAIEDFLQNIPPNED